jgi:3-hydroxyacyl-[acyl-carrier-protein] dehydratase
MIKVTDILRALPYDKPFLFVEKILHVSDDGCEGIYTFDANLPFYKGHFKGQPVTPGVILTECCAQIGLVCLGIYILMQEGKVNEKDLKIAMSSTQMEFLKAVFPDEKVRVKSEKVYFRFSKLKCKVTMFNDRNEVVCKGEISGMIKSDRDA